LDCIGDRVPLNGFTGFSGGLDTKSDSTGIESIYSVHRGHEIMFHVSTMLPYFPKDTQQVERKRHLGNDVVLVIFKESPEDSFPAHTISSQFNHAFIIVQPESGGKYRIASANKFGVKPYGPFIPEGMLFERGLKLREFFLTKVVNAERAAMSAPDFRQRLAKTREILLRDVIDAFKKADGKYGIKMVRKIGEKLSARKTVLEKSLETGVIRQDEMPTLS